MSSPLPRFIPPRGPLATRRGRLATFFCLYLTEGIPLGFTSVALAAQMRRQGLNPEQIGVFVATLYLPWAWKWLVAPVVDLVYSRRLGRRRAWIVGCQGMMIVTLLAASPVDFVTQLSLLTSIILVHNAFAATMDVAIDALACTTLLEEERGEANGLMFAGAYLGNALGGAGVLFLLPYIGVMVSFGLVIGMLLAVLLFVSLRLHEPVADDDAAPRQALTEVPAYANAALRAMLGSSTAIAALCFALLPAGAYALGLALQSNLAVELGFSDQRIALLSACSTVLAAAGCVIGGMLSDRWGRRRMIAL